MWNAKNVNGETVNVDDAKKRIIQHKQEKWNTETNGRWTAKLFLNITRWMERNLERLTIIWHICYPDMIIFVSNCLR